MTKAEKVNWLDRDYVAYYSGCGGIEIKNIQYGIEDYVVFVANAWYGKPSVHRAKIYYGEKNSYFRYNGYRVSFDECIRKGW